MKSNFFIRMDLKNSFSMKNFPVTFLIICLAFSLMFSGCSIFKGGSRQHHLKLTNPSNVERADELVVLTREMIEDKTGRIGEGQYISIMSPDNHPLIVQFDDLNKDGKWDEASFLYTFEPAQSVQVNVSKTNTRLNKAVVRAHVRMRKKNANNSFGPPLDSATIPQGTLPTDFTKQKLPPYLTEGPAWENDKVAFRLYFDVRNTKDIYGKTTTRMMMDTVGVIPENSYHNMADWGMDILAVGKSLGAGSLALNVPSLNGKDTLVRLGGNNIEQTTFEKVADGPVRAILRMHYKNWTVTSNAAPVNLTEEISIWGGKYYYQSKVTITNAPQGAKLVTGIVNLKSKKSNELSIENSKALYTYDAQSENKDNLGLAVIVQNKNFLSFGTTPNTRSEVLNTYTVSLPVTSQPAEYRFYSGWERSDLLFTREENFRRYVENEAVKYGKPVVVSWK